MRGEQITFGRLKGRTLLTARWFIGHEAGQHVILLEGEIVLEEIRSSSWGTILQAMQRGAFRSLLACSHPD
jgi:hypothetical protein